MRHIHLLLFIATLFSSLRAMGQSAPPNWLTDGLVAYYPFNGDAKDASGNGHDGINNGGTFSLDRFGITTNAIAFDAAAGQFVQVPNKEDLNMLGDLTISAWVNIPVLNSNTAYTIVAKRTQGMNSIPYLFGINLQPNPTDWDVPIFVTARGEGTYQYLQAEPQNQVPTNIWVQLTAVVRSDTVFFFQNGNPIGSRSVLPHSRFANTADLLIGSGSRADIPAEFFNGTLDDIRLYNRAISDSEVHSLYQYESTPPQSPGPRSAIAIPQVVNGFVVGATVIDGGAGYTKVPSVAITGGGGNGATAIAILDANGSVASIKVLTAGSGYTGIPTIVIDPPPFPPSQAKGTATLDNGLVTGVNITDTGHGYDGIVPPVTFLGGGGSGAKGTAIVSNGTVTGITITATGSGYTKAPFVLIAAPPGLASLAISVRTVDVTLSLIPGYTYKIQTTTDAGATWLDVESDILAEDKTLVRSFDVTSQTQLFRVVQVN